MLVAALPNLMFDNQMAGGDEYRLGMAARLRALQEALAASDSDMARGAGVSTQSWFHYRTGARKLPWSVAAQIKLRWGVTLEWLGIGDASGNPPALQRKIDAALSNPTPFSRGPTQRN